ncbi:MAG: hypothetical protein Nkreftii_000658 [Candidatus Nitrospira kreftii]|uniref:Uncharacterized protein n=1 Tax=Candidatus Nitrospira kreftii TaxID=2652173 RepID=A0A7S8FB80_9BACT|nr:MAG: hypothetical protein Nkreftii_000658 [Candidatus Nitrospira kreftii]
MSFSVWAQMLLNHLFSNIPVASVRLIVDMLLSILVFSWKLNRSRWLLLWSPQQTKMMRLRLLTTW